MSLPDAIPPDEDLDQLDQLDDDRWLDELADDDRWLVEPELEPDWAEEDPDEAAELDRLAWQHIARLVDGFDELDPANDEPFGDGPGPEAGDQVDDQVGAIAGRIGPDPPPPAEAPGPLVGSLAQLAFGWGPPETAADLRRRATRADPGRASPSWINQAPLDRLGRPIRE